MKHIFIAVFCLLAAALPALPEVYSPEDLPDPRRGAAPSYIADPDGLLSPSAKAEVDSRLAALEKATTVQVGVAVIGSTGDIDDADFAQQLFDRWRPGFKDRDNGIILLVAADDHRVRIHTGYGVEGALPDIAARKIIDRDFIPAMRDGEIDRAVVQTVGAIGAVVSDPAVREELMSGRPADNKASEEASAALWWLIGFVVLACLAASAVTFFVSLRRARRAPDRYHSTLALQAEQTALWWLALFSAGLGLPFALANRAIAHRYRNKAEKCPVCGSKMKKLSESEDNARLTAGQDLEEHLDSVDYDVWECPKCGADTVYAYRNPRSAYTECPVCHVHAMHLAGTRTIQPATPAREGVGERIYECKYCHHRRTDRFRIPRKPSGAEAAVLLGALAAGSRHGGVGGGTGFGGGFGGGMSGGGGASGGW